MSFDGFGPSQHGRLRPLSGVVAGRRPAVVVLVAVLTGTNPRSVTSIMREACTPAKAHRYLSGYPKELDFGVYWFGRNDTFEKAVKGRRSKYFDPTKKTMFFLHGWSGNAGGTTASCYRPTTRCDLDVCPDERMMADAWFDDGWNVGFFYWDQFADEPCARDAEQKVWFDSDRDGRGFRYAFFDIDEPDRGRQFSMYEAQRKREARSIADLCAEAITDATEGFVGSQFRVIGHSLGTQLATHCVHLLHTERKWRNVAKPTRLVLLDPFFTERHMEGLFRCHEFELGQGFSNFKRGVGHFAKDAAAQKIEELYTKGVPTEILLSSPFPENPALGSPIYPIEPLVVLIRSLPTWCGTVASIQALTHIGCRHKAAVIMYFLKAGNKLHVGPRCDPSQPLGCTDEELWNYQNLQHAVAAEGVQQFWTQTEGLDTRDTADDKFTLSEDALTGEALEGFRNFRKRLSARSFSELNPKWKREMVEARESAKAVSRSIVPVVGQATETTTMSAVNAEFEAEENDAATRSDRWKPLRVMCALLLLVLSVACFWLSSRDSPLRRRRVLRPPVQEEDSENDSAPEGGKSPAE